MDKDRVVKEKEVVEKMIGIYCKGKHGTKGGLCPDCQELSQYANMRLTYCRYGEEKSFCSKCPTHCYSPEKKEKIKVVMAYSGPRMLLHSPILTIKHFLGDLRK